MNKLGAISFNGSESAGSPAYTRNNSTVTTPQCPSSESGCDTVSFKSQAYAQPKKKNSLLKWIVGLAVTSVTVVGGLAYAHNTKALSKLSDGKFKDFLKKGEPFAEKCAGWCKTIKTKSVECWDKVKNFFTSNKN